MNSQDIRLTKKRGRPAGVKHSEFVGLRLPSDLAATLDAWVSSQPEPKPSRSEAIRRILAKALAEKDAHSLQSDDSLNRQISDQKTVIAEMPDHSEPSPEAGMAAMDRALAGNDLIDMKNKRTRRKNAKRE